MKNKLLLSALLAMCAAVPQVKAEFVTPQEALSRVSTSARQKAGMRRAPSAMKHVKTVDNLYIFSAGEGYMILPDDDRAPAVLAYSDDGSFENNINPQMRYWLDFYNKQLSWLAENQQTSGFRKAASARPERAAIEPLTTTKWNQEAPYNDLCPEVNGEKTVTGCVATAMAQVMKFYNYPEKGTGTHSYDWTVGNQELSFDYGNTTFEWDKMTDTYDSESSAESREAVARLMLACGISVDMHYDVGDSGASTMNMGSALINYFGYDKSLWMPVRNYYGLYDWEDMVYSELSQGRPVLYSGQGTAGGHQFICDGYSGDGYFHFNWGWGGMSNGYFLLTALNPADLGVGGGAGGFNSDQQITLGMKPAEADSEPTYLMYCVNSFQTEQQQVAAGEQLQFSCSIYNYSMASLPDGSYLGMKILPADGGDARFERGFSIAGLPLLRGYNVDVINFPNLEDGNYVISPAFYDGKKWHEILAPVGAVGSCNATVSNGVATLSAPQVASITVSDIEAPATIYQGTNFPLSFMIENTGSVEYLGKVIPVLMNPETESAVATSVYRPVDIEGGASEAVNDYVGKFTAEEGADFEPGQYVLLICDADGNVIGEGGNVTVEAAPASTSIKVENFELVGGSNVTEKRDLEFSFTVTCEEGYFADRLVLAIFPGTGGNDIGTASTDMMYISAGESYNGTVKIDLSDKPDGNYFAVMYQGTTASSNQLPFTLDFTTGIDEIASEADKAQTIYDLNGVKLNSRPGHTGIYVVNGKKVLIKR